VSRRIYRIEWAEVARRDLFGIVDYLAGRNPGAAAATLEMLQRKASTLRAAPHRGRVIPELHRLQMREYRELIIAPFRLIYRISGHRVLVLGVLDSRRNLEDVLLERLGG
jgi:plasmid stabilization system protein ParE